MRYEEVIEILEMAKRNINDAQSLIDEITRMEVKD